LSALPDVLYRQGVGGQPPMWKSKIRKLPSDAFIRYLAQSIGGRRDDLDRDTASGVARNYEVEIRRVVGAVGSVADERAIIRAVTGQI